MPTPSPFPRVPPAPPARPFHTVLIANRGEIAVRIIRACRDEGLTGVAVFTEPDRDALHVQLADRAVPLTGPPRAAHLDIDGLIDAARRAGADAVHPGYGFVSESADFAAAVTDAGLTWIGPPAASIRLLGDKISARRIAARVGAPVNPGSEGPISGPADVEQFARTHGLPVAIKAAYGGGGRGLKVARAMSEIEPAVDSAITEALAAFGRGECLVERYLEHARHVEVQILADTAGTVRAIGTRDCSVQRRHQKLVEEAPAPFLGAATEAALYDAAKAVCAAAGYVGAGTVEFLVGADGTIAFLEVNTRLQVEHPVTEETTGLDLVREQFRIARGEPLALDHDLAATGHAIEFRINAEDPYRGFAPQPGRLTQVILPAGPGVRVDSGATDDALVSDQFDSLLAKIIIRGSTRQQALARARRALAETEIDGLPTVLNFHRSLLEHDDFAAPAERLGVHTNWIEQVWQPAQEPRQVSVAGGDTQHRTRTIMIGGRPLPVQLPAHVELPDDAPGDTDGAAADIGTGNAVLAPMQGTVVKVLVADGDAVATGDLVAIVEAMKMENPVRAHRDGVVHDLVVSPGSTVAQGVALCVIR